MTSKTHTPGRGVTGRDAASITIGAGSAFLRVDPASDQPFTGELRPLSRIGTVQPDTVVALMHPGKAVELRYPGDTLMPGWRLFRPPVQVLPVSTVRVPLRAVVSSLTTFDEHAVDEVTLRVSVQLADNDGFAVVLDLIEKHGHRFGTYLMDDLQAKIESAVRGAFRLNTLSVLRRALSGILEERWLPPTFADGALVRRSMSVAEVRWPVSGLGAVGVQPIPTAAEPTINQFELSMDARLRRLWVAHCPVQLAGIAGAQIDGAATVVAACEQELGAPDFERLRDAFADLYADPGLVLVVTGVRDYADVVRGWLGQVDDRHVRLLGVDVVRRSDTLRIHLGSALARPGEADRGRPSTYGSEAEALRRLLPHRRIEFEAADTAMTAVVSLDSEEISPVDIGSSGPSPKSEPGRESHHSLRWAWVPAIISVAVNAIFLVAWWLPEFSNFPGHQAALTQLWPLATKELTSAGQPVVQAQVGS